MVYGITEIIYALAWYIAFITKAMSFRCLFLNHNVVSLRGLFSTDRNSKLLIIAAIYQANSLINFYFIYTTTVFL